MCRYRTGLALLALLAVGGVAYFAMVSRTRFVVDDCSQKKPRSVVPATVRGDKAVANAHVLASATSARSTTGTSGLPAPSGTALRVANGAKLLAETVEVGPDGYCRREGVYRTDFNYPLLQVTEVFAPSPGVPAEWRLVKTSVLVATHAVVGVADGASPPPLTVLANEGYRLLEESLGSGFCLVGWEESEARPGQLDAHIERIRALLPGSTYVEGDAVAFSNARPSDPSFDKQWGFDYPYLPEIDIDAIEGWEIATDASSVIVAVVDSGIDFSHPDLAPNLWSNDDWTGNGRDDDHNGYADDYRGWDFVDDDANPSDVDGHGTKVAGVIGAKGDNGTGISGVCWQVRLMSVRVLDANGRGVSSDIAVGVRYAADNGAKIINLSLTTDEKSSALESALSYAQGKGAVCVAAAGNDERDLDVVPTYPACTLGVIAVGGITTNGSRTSYSNWGKKSVALLAPSHGVYTTTKGGGIVSSTGTSLAAPLVSGVFALVAAQNPKLSRAQLTQRVLDNVSCQVHWMDYCSTAGIPNLAWALSPSGGYAAPAVVDPESTGWVLSPGSLKAIFKDLRRPFAVRWVVDGQDVGSAATYELPDGSTSEVECLVSNSYGTATAHWQGYSYVLFDCGEPLYSKVSMTMPNGFEWADGVLRSIDEPVAPYSTLLFEPSGRSVPFRFRYRLHAPGGGRLVYYHSLTKVEVTGITEWREDIIAGNFTWTDLTFYRGAPSDYIEFQIVAPYLPTFQSFANVVELSSGAPFTFDGFDTTKVSSATLYGPNGSVVATSSDGTFSLASVGEAEQGAYRIVLSNSAGTATQITDIRVHPPFAFLERPGAVINATEGQPLNVSASTTDDGGTRYTWSGPRRSGTRPAGPLHFDRVQPIDAGSYTLTATNSLGESLSTTFQLNVVPGKPYLRARPVDCVFDPVAGTKLAVIAGGAEPLAYQWYKNGEPLNGAVERTLQLSGDAASGLYHVVVSNSEGSVESGRVRTNAESGTYTGGSIFVAPVSQTLNETQSLALDIDTSRTNHSESRWVRSSEVASFRASTDGNLDLPVPEKGGIYYFQMYGASHSTVVCSQPVAISLASRPWLVERIPPIALLPEGRSAHVSATAYYQYREAFETVFLLKDGMSSGGASFSSAGRYQVAVVTDEGLFLTNEMTVYAGDEPLPKSAPRSPLTDPILELCGGQTPTLEKRYGGSTLMVHYQCPEGAHLLPNGFVYGDGLMRIELSADMGRSWSAASTGWTGNLSSSPHAFQSPGFQSVTSSLPTLNIPFLLRMRYTVAQAIE